MAGALSYLVVDLDDVEGLFKREGLIPSFLPVLSVLTPFYIAALAAVATFAGPASVDKPFEMSEPVLLEVLGAGGEWEFMNVTPRHFLSFLFGYCTAISIFLLCFSMFSSFFPGVLAVITYGGGELPIGLIVLLFVFMFFLSQLLINTFLGVYYLSDRLHRP
ncbi:hypothetical protein O4G76_06775 [Limimaricola sp. G21655-S1]|uniref:hypothetical protein n=1 Tax=Limimaricola sp. G21655-S1 TaxID=3014768 RepID=UPI0022AF722A|nr:hypothetical protein [Limimaricola sp. G21655-S1]MCZ4260545.1 hypothetical protein [Limimaricola sp. G21655-S1]